MQRYIIFMKALTISERKWLFIIVFLHFHSFGSKLARFHGMKMRKIIAYKIGISFSLFLCNSTIPYLLHLRCKSYVTPIQIPYNSYSRLDLNWSWIGLGLELPRAYIEEETRINFGLPMIFFITTKQKKVFRVFPVTPSYLLYISKLCVTGRLLSCHIAVTI